jgi:SulP family sulfate permease
MRRMAAAVKVEKLTEEELGAELAKNGLVKMPPGVLVYAIEGPFFFGAVENFERALAQTHTDPRVLVLRLRHVPFIDITGFQTLEEVIEKMRRRGIRVVLCEARGRVKVKLDRAGLLATLGAQNYVDDFTTAIDRCNAAASGAAPKNDGATPLST